MKIAYLGAGAWGFCLASLLSTKGNKVVSWTRNTELFDLLNSGKEHPHLKGHAKLEGMEFTTDLIEAIEGADMIVEAVTTAGLRPVFESIKNVVSQDALVVLTSKGIEQNSGLTPPNIALDVLGVQFKKNIAFLSGPGYAKDVIRGLPTSIVGTAFDYEAMMKACSTFTTSSFRVYPNSDIIGVSYGGALKNVIAIACGISEGLNLGSSSTAALMTRGLHEIRKLALAFGSKSDTLSGLSGMGDVCLTCGSLTSRNSRFGYLLARGMTKEEAFKEIDMVVEGAYTSISAMQISKQVDVAMPISEMVYKIIYEEMPPLLAVKTLMARTIKEEHL